MHPRASWLRATCSALIAFVFVLSPASRTASAADKDKEKKPARTVVRFVAYKEKVPYQGKSVMVLAVESLTGGRQMELVVKNQDMNKRDYNPVINTDHVNALDKGQAIKIELDDSRNPPMVTYLRKYDLKPGEEAPHVYRFMNKYDANNGAYTAVVLNRFDDPVTVAVPRPKGREGAASAASSAAAEMEKLVEELKTDELVEAEFRESRPTPVLVSIDRYTPPRAGRFLKLSEEDVAEGQKGQAVEIDQGGKTVRALLPGRLQGKKWVSDAKVLAAARKLKADADVVYRTRQDGDKLYLKEIEPAPKAKAEKATSRDRDARDRDMGRDADGADAGERRGRRPRNDR